MHRPQEQVRDFMRALHHPTPDTIEKLDTKRLKLRLDLILEEAQELVEASGFAIDEAGGEDDPEAAVAVPVYGERPNMSAQIDALCDLLYVTYGMAVEMGVDLEPFFELVHASNMKKLGGPVREDGKTLKPEGWKPPDIEGRLRSLLLIQSKLDPDVV